MYSFYLFHVSTECSSEDVALMEVGACSFWFACSSLMSHSRKISPRKYAYYHLKCEFAYLIYELPIDAYCTWTLKKRIRSSNSPFVLNKNIYNILLYKFNGLMLLAHKNPSCILIKQSNVQRCGSRHSVFPCKGRFVS